MIDQTDRDIRAAAVVASSAIIIAFTLYWGLEIQAVREMLKLAYG